MSRKPMLASQLEDIGMLKLPVLASPKLDGIRALVIDGVVMSRNFKPIPNKHVQRIWGRAELNGFDGELIMGDPTDPAAYRNTMSAVMSADGEPEVGFHLFDDYDAYEVSRFGFELRLERLQARVGTLFGLSSLITPDNTLIVPQKRVYELSHLEDMEGLALQQGYEGLMLRHLNGPYKYGRSTVREGWLLKLKRFSDMEAQVVGFDEQMRNDNELTRDELGRAKRTSHKENKVSKGTLGSLKLVGVGDENPYKGVHFDCGTGFTDDLRKLIWDDQPSYMGKVAKIKFFPSGSKDKPRFPVFLGWRPVGA